MDIDYILALIKLRIIPVNFTEEITIEQDPLLNFIQQPLKVDAIRLDFSLSEPLKDIQPSEAQPPQASYFAEEPHNPIKGNSH